MAITERHDDPPFGQSDLSAITDTAQPEGGAAVSPLVGYLEAAAAAVRAASEKGLPAPLCVTVTGGGCTAMFDTPGLVAWGAMFPRRPYFTLFEGSPYISAVGLIGGTPWRLHNGYRLPESAGAGAPPAVGDTPQTSDERGRIREAEAIGA